MLNTDKSGARTSRKPKLALLLNVIAPARLPLYSILAEEFELLLLHGGQEANRDTWNDFAEALPNARVVRAWGWQMRLAKKVDGQVFDEKFIHITPGFAWHLFGFRPDLVISNEMGLRSMIALLYGTLLRAPVWIWWGGTLHSERAIGPLRKFVRRAITFWSDRWISYGQTSTEYLESCGIRRDRILQSQNSIDDGRFAEECDALWEIAPKPVVLFAGQFIERKGIGFLLEAAAKVQREGHAFSLLLVGSGRERQAVEERAKALGIENVFFRASQKPELMPAVYRSTDVMVLPTLEDVWGLVANEAILSGVPVLCSKYAGCAQELFPAENIFDPRDAEDFAGKLRRAVNGQIAAADRSRLRGSKQLGRELVAELYSALPSRMTPDVSAAPESSLRES